MSTTTHKGWNTAGSMFEDPINDQLFKHGTNCVVFDHLSDVVPLMNLIIAKRPSLG